MNNKEINAGRYADTVVSTWSDKPVSSENLHDIAYYAYLAGIRYAERMSNL